MRTNGPLNPFELSGERHELAQLVGRIQTLTLELEELQSRELDTAAADAKKRTLDQLRWRLAAVARRTATAELGNAA